MSASSVQRIIRKSVSDPAFLALLVDDPITALASYELTPEERAMLSKLDASVFDGNTTDLEERLSRAKYTGN
jgi:hypothetical protein